ncbi:PEP-CTERM sorting domain-containing protein [Litorilituus sediminis]|uniref:PEP-CTERM sorting domain-containing protein n=1 Tax=Litorilituus sediminis TaxID=718192 RepID=A0A4P6PCP6_9GAMM|nr:PEP-CTERM sorting domain-containing protein [Litorilituus sediminis]QBG37542.1 PEP-CTERM sorting domain-containing protein [Litorilituus sediminis]
MKKYKLLPALTGALLTLTSLTSQAGIISGWGANTWTRTGDDCMNRCDLIEYDRDGGHLSTYSRAEENTYGETRALVDITGAGYLPTLKVYAKASTPDLYNTATAFASQGFDYLGSTSTTISLDINLHGSVTGNARLSSAVGVLIGDHWGYYAGFATGFGEAGLLSGMGNGGENYLSILSGTNVNKQGNISFNINPGESFYILSEMRASATNGIADSWNTLTMNFADASKLRAATAPKNGTIPEPSVLLLMLLGLGFVYRKQAR